MVGQQEDLRAPLCVASTRFFPSSVTPEGRRPADWPPILRPSLKTMSTVEALRDGADVANARAPITADRKSVV